MIKILLLSNLITLILLIWFKSDEIVDWGSLLGTFQILKLEEFYHERLQ